MEILPSAPFCVPVPPPAQKVGLGIEGKRLLLHLLFICFLSLKGVYVHIQYTHVCAHKPLIHVQKYVFYYIYM